MLPWYLLFVVGMLLLDFGWPPHEWSGFFARLLWLVTDDTALVLPFLLFGAGVALGSVRWHTRRLMQVALVVGISVSAIAYGPGPEHRPAS